jgi:nitrite reductase/ring-hydroxylating ferredoxin subunit
MGEEFVPVAKTADLSPGQMKWVAVNGERRVLANVEGAFYAISDVCGHRNAPLSRGRLQGYLIECPLHFAQFDVRTGELVDGPVSTPVPIYEVRVEGDIVYVNPRPIPPPLAGEGGVGVAGGGA